MLDFKELFDYNLIHENKHPLIFNPFRISSAVE